MTLSRPQAAALLADNGLAPQRSLGQNFVVDPNTVRKIARIADVRSGDIVLEIGAGLGSLTAALAETGAQVIAVEVDRGIVPEVPAAVPEIPFRCLSVWRRSGLGKTRFTMIRKG